MAWKGQGSFDEPSAEPCSSEKEEPADRRQWYPRPRDGKVVEQKTQNKIMLKAILKTHQTMGDLSSTVWDTLLIMASSPEADNMQKQTQTYAEKVRQEWKGHTRGPPFVWAYLGLVKSFQQREKAEGARTAQGTVTYWARLEPLSPMQICDEVRFCTLDKPCKADIKTLNIVSPEKQLLVLEALSQTESECNCGRVPPTAMEGELQAFLEGLLKT